jgi:cellulose synthase (UDP-forming)
VKLTPPGPPALAMRNKASGITGKPGAFQLLVNNKPFYVQGIAYNSGDNWRDNNYPPTRQQLEHDFTAIRQMGGNTIRRYHPSVYDRNILTVAQEQGLKVLYGFWFDPAIDYYRDTAQVQQYIRMVEQYIRQYKDYPAVLGWSVGNETSGLLKKHFTQPYLNTVRKAYMEMIEQMARRIHALDRNRPVFTSLEHSWQLPGELYSYHQLVPSVDIMSINSYYEQQISRLKTLTHDFDSTRPYLVSEFGPRGYWNPELSAFDKYNVLVEDEDKQKGGLYLKEWNEYVSRHRGSNIGGVAYCWRDRMEGTATWFGITDYKQRRKPVYYALQQAWTHKVSPAAGNNVFIVGPDFKLNPGDPYEFRAICNNPAYKAAEWHLYKDETFKEAGKLVPSTKNGAVWIIAPSAPATYRLYVHLSDGKGNVVTASKPVTLNLPVKSTLQ